LAGQSRHDVNVVQGVSDRHPPHTQIITLRRQPCPVHDPGRHLRPLAVRKHAVFGRGTHRAVPHRLVTALEGKRRYRLSQQPHQATQIR